MATQTKLWKQRNPARPAMLSLDRLPGLTSGASSQQFAADMAWISKCVADRRRERSEGASLHVYQASLQGINAYAA